MEQPLRCVVGRVRQQSKHQRRTASVHQPSKRKGEQNRQHRHLHNPDQAIQGFTLHAVEKSPEHGEVPGAPDKSDHNAGIERRHVGLQTGLVVTAPTNFLTQQQHAKKQERQRPLLQHFRDGQMRHFDAKVQARQPFLEDHAKGHRQQGKRIQVEGHSNVNETPPDAHQPRFAAKPVSAGQRQGHRHPDDDQGHLPVPLHARFHGHHRLGESDDQSDGKRGGQHQGRVGPELRGAHAIVPDNANPVH